MPGDISQPHPGPGDDSPYVPSWCYKDQGGPKQCECGHHEGYHNDKDECLHAHHFTKCGCTGFREVLEEV